MTQPPPKTPSSAAAQPHAALDELAREQREERLRGHLAGMALSAYLVLCGVPVLVLTLALVSRLL